MAKRVKKQELIPPDKKQCQAEKPNGNTFMTLGGVPGLERCKNKPKVIATEAQPGEDGLKGSMSLCLPCLSQLRKQLGPEAVTVKAVFSFDISSDGKTVWVNGENGCLARFGQNGIDIHTDEGLTDCLFCTHSPTTTQDWELFVSKMQFFYGIKVPAKYKPKKWK